MEITRDISGGSSPRSSAAILDDLHHNRLAEGRLAAERHRLIDELRHANLAEQHTIVLGARGDHDRDDLIARVTSSEVAVTLNVAEQVATDAVHQARTLCDELPTTLAGLDAGELTPACVKRIVTTAWQIPADLVGEFERRVLAGSWDISPAAWSRRCRVISERLHPRSVDERHAVARADRRVSVEHGPDGMSWLTAFLPTVDAHALHAALSARARDARDANDPRTIDQLRADALRDAILTPFAPPDGVHPTDADDPARSLRRVRAEVTVTVPLLTLLGVTTQPAILDGVGPISIDVARALAANAPSWHRVLTHPVTGIELVHDRTTYRVPAALRRWLARRDRTCRFPGCGRTARRCDADHLDAWEHGGCTDADNLAHLCRHHHRLKHETTWRVRSDPDTGDLMWVDPAGRTYRDPVLMDEPPPLSDAEILRDIAEYEAMRDQSGDTIRG